MKNALRTGLVCLSGLCAGLLVAVVGVAVMGCLAPDVGGLDNEEEVGRQERGRDPGSYWLDHSEPEYDPETGEYTGPEWEYILSYSEVILAPDGNSLLAMVPVPGPDQGYDAPGLILAVQPLPQGVVRYFPEVRDVRRFNFSPEGDRAYALSHDGQEVQVINLRTFALEESYPLSDPHAVVDVTPDGAYLVLSNLPTTDVAETYLYGGLDNSCVVGTNWEYWGFAPGANLCRFTLVKLATGEVRSHTVDARLRDIDFSPVGGELLLTTSRWKDTGEEYLPEATVHFFSPELNEMVDVTHFPNCADELVVDTIRERALLSPVRCSPPKHPSQVEPPPANMDPISVINLVSRKFVANLPGFGPVVLAREGDTAVGFTRRQTLEEEWSYFDQQTAIGLIFVDLDTLDWTIVDYGNDEPTFTVSPDGRRLYLYEDDYAWSQDGSGKWHVGADNAGLKQYDFVTEEWSTLTNVTTTMDRYVWTDDGSTMYFLSDERLFQLDVASGEVNEIPTIGTPDNINLRPQQDFLVLGESDAPDFYLLERAQAFTLTASSLGIE